MPRQDGSPTPFDNPKKAVEYGRLGGIKSGEAKKRKKAMKEVAELFLNLSTGKGQRINLENVEKLDDLFKKERGKMIPKNMSVAEIIILKQIQLAMKGDLNSAKFIRETSGQEPTNNIKVDGALPVVITGEDDLVDYEPSED